MNKYRLKIYNYIFEGDNKGYSREKILEQLYSKGYDKVFISDIIKEVDIDREKAKNKKPFFKRISFKWVGKSNETKPKKDTPNPEPMEVVTETLVGVTPSLGLTAKVDSINEKLDMMTESKLDKKYKQFNLPNKVTKELKKLGERNKVLVILLKTNRTIQPIITDIIDGFIAINGVPHNCSTDFIFMWKGKYPAIVLPEWDLNPIGTEDFYKALGEKRTANPVAVAIRMINSKEQLLKKGFEFDGKWWVFIILGAIAIGYLIFTK